MLKFFSKESSLFWRNCDTGKFIYTMWEFKSLRSFWKSVFSLITVMGLIISPSPSLAICNMTHILKAARLTSTFKWRSIIAPNVSEVIYSVKMQYVYEKHFSLSTNSISVFTKRWASWILIYTSDD